MNENKKMMIIGTIALAIIAIIPLTAVFSNAKSKEILEEVHEYIKDDEYNIVYIGRDDCSYCNFFEPEIELISEKMDIDYLYVNTNELKSSHFNQLLKDLEIDESDFGTPYLVITKDGKIFDKHAGYMPEYKLLEYLKEQGVVEEDENLPLNYLEYEEYNNIINSNEKQIVLIAQSGCEGCTKARPVLYELAEEYDVKINYLNASMLSQENATSFQESLTFFEENGISTPMMLVVSNKKVIDSLVGSVDKDTYVEFLKENNFIKGE